MVKLFPAPLLESDRDGKKVREKRDKSPRKSQSGLEQRSASGHSAIDADLVVLSRWRLRFRLELAERPTASRGGWPVRSPLAVATTKTPQGRLKELIETWS
jgi:hypothetical protein